ncbi:hypothetical protein RhiirA4_451992 [Rhizophagus irregularis]|uniref:Uncharacterized protein n=1 Tax=Rhizophagus irregularis TaxID=588596 RepID=A0A2I1FWZ4_9GLOM|nr:hypothetical protein RhiirA4_451992 [Rhizophagus irregularis]
MDSHHDIYLLIHQYIPTLFQRYLRKSSTTRTGLLNFLTPLMVDLDKLVWLEHISKVKKWEKTKGITHGPKDHVGKIRIHAPTSDFSHTHHQRNICTTKRPHIDILQPFAKRKVLITIL